MRVLTLTPFYPTASDDGAGCFVAEPIRALDNLGVESCVIAVQPYYRDTVAPDTIVPRSNWVRFAAAPGGFGLASAGAFLYARLLLGVRRLHSAHPFDLIHAHAALPCGHAASLLSRDLRVPYVVTVHGLDAYFNRQVTRIAGRWCQRKAESVYASAARVICISTKVAEQVTIGDTANAATTVIYNGVDPELFGGAGPEAHSPTLLSIGNLIPIKGHEVLLRALAAVKERCSDLQCEIIGDGPELPHLKELAVQLGIASNVRFLLRQSRRQVADAMRRCTIFALPSRYEGLGCVYLEAMAAEKAAIACHGQGIDEIIQHRENGWLVETGNWHDLADAIALLIEKRDLRARIGRAARGTILEGFTLAHQASRLAQVYRECAA